MQNPPLPLRRSPLAWAALATILILATMGLIAALGPPALVAIGALVALLVGFAICALPFAAVLGLVLLITRHHRASAPAMYAYPPYPLDPQPAAVPGRRPGRAAASPVRSRRRPDPAADLPPAVQGLVVKIHDKIAALRDPRQWQLVSPEDQIHIERIGGEYLPAILETFRSIPRGTEEWAVDPEGRRAVDLVEHQLRLLEQGLDAIAERVFKAGAAQLMAQQQFLEDRLGEGSPSELWIPPAS